MLTMYGAEGGKLAKLERADGQEVVWIDLCEPTKDEDAAVEALTGVSIPSHDEMQEIEASSRIYQESGAHFMTATVLHQEDANGTPPVSLRRHAAALTTDLPPVPMSTQVTFILVRKLLVTVRYKEPRAFPLFLSRNQKGDLLASNGITVLIGLLEAVIDREADRVERLQADVDKIGNRIFEIRGGAASVNRRYDLAVKQIGREGELTSRSSESMQSLRRVLSYLGLVASERNEDKAVRTRIKTAVRDVESLNHQIEYLSEKVAFLLNATLGLINLQQTNIIKFFTVVAVVLMPPTLIASIYGMNFKHMPELEWTLGYPMAVLLMVISAILPFVYFRRRGWL